MCARVCCMFFSLCCFNRMFCSQAVDQQRLQLEQQKGLVDSDVDALSKSLDELTLWLNTNDKTAQELDIDTVTEPKDILTKQ